jgi:PKD repeat protein
VIQPDNAQTININAAGHYQVTMKVYGNRDTCTFYLDTIVPGNSTIVKALFSNTTVCVGNSTKFTDESISSAGITQWSWDFNNDGVEDSNLQNPSYT